MPFPPPGNLLYPETGPASPALAGEFFTTEPPEKPRIMLWLLFSCSARSYSLQPHGLQHTRLPCPSPSPGACSNSCPSNHFILCRPLLLCPQSFPASGSFAMVGSLHQAVRVLGLRRQPLQCVLRAGFRGVACVCRCSQPVPFASPTVSTRPFSTSAFLFLKGRLLIR